MSAEDWIPDDFEAGDEGPREVRCKHCGERDLWWTRYHGAWRLVNGEGELHTCRAERSRAAEFRDAD